jgi:hypothetical protein
MFLLLKRVHYSVGRTCLLQSEGFRSFILVKLQQIKIYLLTFANLCNPNRLYTVLCVAVIFYNFPSYKSSIGKIKS